MDMPFFISNSNSSSSNNKNDEKKGVSNAKPNMPQNRSHLMHSILLYLKPLCLFKRIINWMKSREREREREQTLYTAHCKWTTIQQWKDTQLMHADTKSARRQSSIKSRHIKLILIICEWHFSCYFGFPQAFPFICKPFILVPWQNNVYNFNTMIIEFITNATLLLTMSEGEISKI